MKQVSTTISTSTRGPALYELTSQVTDFVRQSEIANGLFTCFVRHTSASLVVQENADPDVLRDLADFMNRLVSRDERLYRHTTEGPDDMPSHIRAMLTQSSLSVPVCDGKMMLGRWQALYLFEHRDTPHERTTVLHIIGD